MKRVMTMVVAVLLTAGVAAQSGAVKPAAKFDGQWRVTTINGGSPEDMAGGEMVLVIAGGKYQQLIGAVLTEEGTITIDASKVPAHVDLAIGTGPDAGKNQRGLLEVKGDVMTMTLSMPDADPARTPTLTEGALVVAAARIK